MNMDIHMSMGEHMLAEGFAEELELLEVSGSQKLAEVSEELGLKAKSVLNIYLCRIIYLIIP